MKSQLAGIERLFREGRLSAAEKSIAIGLEAEPHLACLHFWRGKVHFRKQEWGKAINAFQRVLEIDPHYPEAREQMEMARSILDFYTPDMFNP
ncbi:MAG: tetratricopeptide repeat protein [Mangrovibacterium sp.]